MLRILAAGLAGSALLTGWTLLHPPGSPIALPLPIPEIQANDNRTPAGALSGGVLTVELVARQGTWFPEGEAGPGHEVYAFGERGQDLRNPGPLLRVPAGTEIHATVRNEIEGETLIVHGLYDRPGAPDTLHVPPGASRSVRFTANAAGTYLYWATTRGARSLVDRWGKESQLSGALIVDPSGPVPPDRVFVIGIEDDSAAIPALRTVNAAVVNGRSWPHTERFTAHAGDTIRMRWINASDRFHPMHLHGFHFRVESRGDGVRDTVYAASDQQEVVTELMGRGGTFSMTWVPRRPGNWLMHCHMTEHFSHRLRKGGRAPDHSSHKLNHALDVMSGLVLGWQILPNGETQSTPASATTARALRLVAQPAGVKLADLAGLGFTLQEEGARGPADPVAIPGPPLVLVRGETVRVRVVNQLTERTAIHWHGIELDSYFDGVSGWSGDASRTSPHVEPGDSFDVRFTPPRAGTFIYHSHFDEERQLASGLFGPLIVLEKGERYDPRTDHSWILSQAGWTPSDPILLNASRSPMIELDAEISHRVRLINISPSIPLTFQLLVDSVPVTWRALAKDGADLPASQARSQPATVQIGVGETYDFELPSSVEGELQLRVRDPVGRIRLEGTVRVARSRR